MLVGRDGSVVSFQMSVNFSFISYFELGLIVDGWKIEKVSSSIVRIESRNSEKCVREAIGRKVKVGLQFFNDRVVLMCGHGTSRGWFDGV